MENNNLLSKENKIKYFLKRSITFLANGFFFRAFICINKVIELEPFHSKAKAIACLCLIKMHDLEGAFHLLEPDNQSLKALLLKKKQEINDKIKQNQEYKYILTFLNVLSLNNSYSPNIDIFYYNEFNRGVIATKKIHKSEIILTVPKKCIITLDIVKESEIGKEIVKFMNYSLNSPKHCLFACFLLNEELDCNSQWKYYLDILPKNFSNYPYFYNKSEIDLLQGTQFLLQMQEKKKEIIDDFQIICEKIPKLKNKLLFSDFLRARLIVSSRLFGVAINKIKTDVLVPYADMLNHSPQNQTSWYYDDLVESFVVEAIDTIKKGKEIFDSYGKKTNTSYLLNYGFTILNNRENNEYQLTLILNRENCCLFDLKKPFIEQEFSSTLTFTLSTHLYNSNIIDLFSFLRFITFDSKNNIQKLFEAIKLGQDYEYNNQNSIPIFYYINSLSVDNERKVLRKLKEICTKELSRYPTSYQEDYQILKNEQEITLNSKNCIIIRMSEKEILLFFIELCDYCLNLLTLNDFDKITKKLYYDYKDSYCPFEYYINKYLFFLYREDKV